MPAIRVDLFEGRSPEVKKQLIEAITQAVVDTLKCSPDAVDIILNEVPKSHWATGGKLWSEPRE
ncbi:MAG: 4-oxalocrotonate tautomerase [Thiomonas arsenitoxydans]|jgi:4-oxalocrotonate tautomerase|uniref:Tautomerase n=1 Tax=Thiomonas arsenitoxydans (strain DSM 22701 / CIP 110005 / 3As) TaxID=426114 RepID=A0A8I1MWF0_THIA3|nr:MULTISPECIES: 4-oxalocrotonate tautomerase [Thiomonas]MBN8744177.1 4-oxalocrotonate tautomerase [Thiomonas arsenitoxydans]ODU95423.1 MAG: 4-oxalocrotonate tautomerase [Thiomonas sp. SCN 64-16]